MSNTRHKDTGTDYVGRQSLRVSLSVAWLKKNKPLIWQQILQLAIEEFPAQKNAQKTSSRTQAMLVLLPKEHKP
jgi:hypothetical protein